MRIKTTLVTILLVVAAVMLAIMPAMAQQVTGHVGFAQRHHHYLR